ncbi:xyloglucan galactosyltransferase XLT2 [Coffea eugenioides]|uniref:xyloglucan galactosyltransferase XLT2 n=1 Tax=Coffea eugenioides TaxID=49369 RepID=UPI000F6138A5|nr:xyloglucan galactosyltransferase XLT2 [Coffea eugenioides]
MLPISMTTPPSKPPSKPKNPELSSNRKNYSNLFQPYLSFHHPGTCLLLAILLLHIFLLLSARSLPFFPTSHPSKILFPPSTTVTPGHSATLDVDGSNQTALNLNVLCPYGKVYVYDLPSFFNHELLKNCHELSPWNSGCDLFSNHGFGKVANGISKLVPENLRHAWHWTDQFALEMLHHNRMMNYRCRSLEPESATAFYIPFYAGLAVGKYLWYNHTFEDRDRYCEMMLDWVNNQPYWNRSHGWDHFITMGRITWDFRRIEGRVWGSSCIYMPGMRNITRLLIERNPWDYFDVGVPYPTGFHPSTASDVTGWQDFVRQHQRKTLYCFAGGTRGFYRNDFRGLLLSQCYNNSDACRVVDCTGSKCSNGTSAILESFLDSDFCLQPRGDSFTRRSIFDCMVAGSIPVFFWRRTAYMQYAWFLPSQPDSYSVFIHRGEVQNGTTSIRAVLESISKEKVKMMREKVIEYLPRIVYAKPNEGLEGIKDAFDIAVEGVLRRVKQKEGVYK